MGYYEAMPYYPMQMQNLGFKLKKITKPVKKATHSVVKVGKQAEKVYNSPYGQVAVAVIGL